jgi:hypothetical protein
VEAKHDIGEKSRWKTDKKMVSPIGGLKKELGKLAIQSP